MPCNIKIIIRYYPYINIRILAKPFKILLWNEVINEMRSNPPINEREINFRIYKDNKSFRDYQINSVRECQEIILGGIS